MRYWKDVRTYVGRCVFLHGLSAEHFTLEECGSLWLETAAQKHFSRACFYGFFYKEERRGGEVFGSFITVLLVYLDSHVNRIITRVARFAEPCIRL